MYSKKSIGRLAEINQEIDGIRARTRVDDDWGYQYTDDDEARIEELQSEERAINAAEKDAAWDRAH